MVFFLGSHQPYWLRILDVPMMISHRTLGRYKTLPRARGPWYKDSGGFTRLDTHGSWDGLPVEQFVSETRRYADEVGNMAYCAPQDWMCEPRILAKTGLTITEHQRRTVANFLDLQQKAPDLPWTPVIQGWTLNDYLRCVEMYDRSGVDLFGTPPKDGEEDRRPLVGVGSICRRQGTEKAANILRRLASEGIRLHAFGLKILGIPNVAPFVASADSLAWSYAARRESPLPGCTAHKNCANCMRYALRWLGRVQALIDRHQQASYQLALTF